MTTERRLDAGEAAPDASIPMLARFFSAMMQARDGLMRERSPSAIAKP
ncbi:hypothetical protein [Agrobacterium sp. LMR679]|nr:hypothetical protein [Agrobacterium sp. LMR679]MCZ4072074.1 hypothetical protein [Agrobacterium sp. LMR679]